MLHGQGVLGLGLPSCQAQDGQDDLQDLQVLLEVLELLEPQKEADDCELPRHCTWQYQPVEGLPAFLVLVPWL